MIQEPIHGLNARPPLRLWPGIALAIVMVVSRYVLPVMTADLEIMAMPMPVIGMFVGILCSVAIAIWWLLFSRAAWYERISAGVLMVVGILAVRLFVHESISGGMMGRMLYVYSPTIVALGLVVAVVVARHLAPGRRAIVTAGGILLACASFTLIRTDGVIGAGSQLAWRWTPTPEERLLARGPDEPPATPPAAVADTPQSPGPVAPPAAAPVPPGQNNPLPRAAATSDVAPVASERGAGEAAKPRASVAAESPGKSEWPGFRGPGRDGVVRGVEIETNWSQTPPAALWRRPIGPGWSSFAVQGELIFTQEQRGDEEMVSCYRLSTGEPVWRHSDRVRFYESNGGPGPRGTPALHGGRVYALGATGILNALDAATGKVIWSRNIATDTGVVVPEWGITSSPLIVDDLVVVAVGGQLIAYDAGAGHQRWLGPSGGGGYSSPHLLTVAGVPQIVLLRGSRTISVAPADGSLLWEHRWVVGVGIVQPALADGDVLITTGDAMGGLGIQRVNVSHDAGGWHTAERWSSRGLKPYFSDFVVHEGHAYGFDGSILSSIELEGGTRKWKGGRYGSGQLMLLADQGLLLVSSEEGELALVRASPDKFTEVARFQALDGKTWNHSVLVGDVLLMRNGEEMAAFRLALAGRSTTSR